jgi:malate/lactate dehydrogenase
MTVPVIISKNGIQSIQERQLAPDEMEELKNTVNILTPYMRFVEDTLGIRLE